MTLPRLRTLVLFSLFCCGLLPCGELLAQRFARGGLVMPKNADVTWQVAEEDDDEAIELNPSDVWLPWKIRRIEGSRVYFRFEGKDVSCLARKVIPLSQAADYFKEQIEAEPENAWLHKSLGQAFAETSRHESALPSFDEAFKLDPSDLGCMTWKGYSYWQMDQMDKAENCFRKVAGNEQYESEMRVYRGLMYFVQGDFEKALEQFDKSEMDTTMLMRLKADCHLKLQKPELAIELYDQWVATDPLDAMAYYKRSLFHLRSDEPDIALGDISISLRLDPDYTSAYLLRGTIHNNKQQYELALLDYDEAIKREPQRTSAHEKRYELLATLGRYKEAVDGVTKRLELDDTFDWGYYQRSVFQGEMEDFPAAIEDVTKAIRMDPSYPDYLIQRAKYYSRNRQAKECMQDYDRAIEMDPDNAKYYYERGRFQVRIGRYESGLSDLDVAVEKTPDNLGLLYTRGMAYKDLGNYELALEDLDKCRKLNPTNPYVVREFVWVLVAHPDEDKRDTRRALRWMSKVMDPEVVTDYEDDGVTEWTDPEFHSIMAATLAANGKFADAVTAQEKAIELTEKEDKDLTKRLQLYKNSKPYVFDGGQWFEDY